MPSIPFTGTGGRHGRGDHEGRRTNLSHDRGYRMLTELGRSQVEVQQCPLRAEVGEELGEELATRK